jgi:hypothetical protein
MIYELEMITREAVVVYWKYYPMISVDRLRKTTENLSQNNSCPGQSVTVTQTRSDTAILNLRTIYN